MMTKRGGYQQTAAGAFGAGGEPLTAEECTLCGGTGEIETLDRQEAACPVCVTREKDATITALRAEVADVRRGALLEAAEALDAESKRIAAEADHLERTNPDWHRRYDRACGVQDAADLIRARAATPARKEANPRAAPESCRACGRVAGWRCDDRGKRCALCHAPYDDFPPAAPRAAGGEEPRPLSPAPASGPERELLDEAFGGGGAPAPPAPDPRDARIAQLEAVCEGAIALLERLHEFVAVRQIRASLSAPPAAPQAAGSKEKS